MEPVRHSWTNGKFDAGVSPYDPGWQQGLAVFETVGVFTGPDPLPLWSRHLDRLGRGASVLGLSSVVPTGLRQAAEEVLRRNVGDDVLRIMQTAETWSLTTRSRSVRSRPQVLAVSEFQRHLLLPPQQRQLLPLRSPPPPLQPQPPLGLQIPQD